MHAGGEVNSMADTNKRGSRVNCSSYQGTLMLHLNSTLLYYMHIAHFFFFFLILQMVMSPIKRIKSMSDRYMALEVLRTHGRNSEFQRLAVYGVTIQKTQKILVGKKKKNQGNYLLKKTPTHVVMMNFVAHCLNQCT